MSKNDVVVTNAFFIKNALATLASIELITNLEYIFAKLLSLLVVRKNNRFRDYSDIKTSFILLDIQKREYIDYCKDSLHSYIEY